MDTIREVSFNLNDHFTNLIGKSLMTGKTYSKSIKKSPTEVGNQSYSETQVHPYEEIVPSSKSWKSTTWWAIPSFKQYTKYKVVIDLVHVTVDTMPWTYKNVLKTPCDVV